MCSTEAWAARSTQDRVDGLLCEGWALYRLLRLEEADVILNEALLLADDELSAAKAQRRLGRTRQRLGDNDAEELVREARETFDRLGDAHGGALARVDLAAFALVRGDFRGAWKLYEETLKVGRGDLEAEGLGQDGLAYIACDIGDWSACAWWADRAIKSHLAGKKPGWAARAINRRITALMGEGRLLESLDTAYRGISLGDPVGQQTSGLWAASVLTRLSLSDEALYLLDRLPLRLQDRNERWRALARRRLVIKLGRLDEMRDGRILPNNVIEEAQLTALVARAHAARGDVEQAEAELRPVLMRLLYADGFGPGFAERWQEEFADLLSWQIEIGDTESAWRVLESLRGLGDRTVALTPLGPQSSATSAMARGRSIFGGPVDRMTAPLPAGTGALSWHLSSTRTIALWRLDGQVKAWISDQPLDGLQRVAERLNHVVQAHKPWRSLASAVAASTLGPLAREVAQAERIVIVPTGPLHQVPWGVVPVEGRPLVEVAPYSRSSSAGAFAVKQARKVDWSQATIRALVDPDGDLLRAKQAGEWLADVHPSARLMAGAEATAAAAKWALMRPGIVHLGTHAGSVGGVALLRLHQGGQYAGVTAQVLRSAWRGIRGGVSPRGWTVQADLVDVSACGTLGRSAGGGEPIGVLGPIFLAGGARSVLANLWPVRDAVAEQATYLLYDLLMQGVELGEAHQRVRLRLRDGLASVEGTDHPSVWGAWTIYGAQ